MQTNGKSQTLRVFPPKTFWIFVVLVVFAGCVYFTLQMITTSRKWLWPLKPEDPNGSGTGSTRKGSRTGSIPNRSGTGSTTTGNIWHSPAANVMPRVLIVESQSVVEGVQSQGTVTRNSSSEARSRMTPVQTQTSDHWPVFSKEYFTKNPIPPSPYQPNFTILWDFNTSAFLLRPDVRDRPPKVMTWMVKPRYFPPLPEPVRLRVCPEMPCRMTTNSSVYWKNSSALLWAGQIMRQPEPPHRTHPDQAFVFHNNEPQKHDWIYAPSFRKPAWKSVFNWTMGNRFDSDLSSLFGYVVQREKPVLSRNYSEIVSKKTGLVAWLVSHCKTEGRREQYVNQLKRYLTVDVYGGCSPTNHCPRSKDGECLNRISQKYKFYLSFENAFCKDYVSEKFFRYLVSDAIVVVRGSNDYKNHAPPGTFINTADFNSPKELADRLLYLDRHPEHYIQLLKAKDRFLPVTEDWPTRSRDGGIHFIEYHFESPSFCEMCRRLWEPDRYRNAVPDIVRWFDRANCYPPLDL